MDNSKNRHNDHNLGVNKLGKNIRKSPLHQPNFNNNNQAARQQPQPQVYNISKNDFRNMVQQLTGSPSRDPAPPPNQNNSPKPQSVRLQRIRPPPLTPIHRPGSPQFGQNPFSQPGPGPSLFGQPPIQQHQPHFAPAESPITAYMNYLQNSILTDPSPRQPMPAPQQPPLPPGLLPSPPPQFLLPSPTGYFGLLSPRSPYPLMSPGMMQFPPLTPNFGFGQMAQSGILGPGPSPNQAGPPPLSPGLLFPLSPSGFFPISSPRWRGQ